MIKCVFPSYCHISIADDAGRSADGVAIAFAIAKAIQVYYKAVVTCVGNMMGALGYLTNNVFMGRETWNAVELRGTNGT